MSSLPFSAPEFRAEVIAYAATLAEPEPVADLPDAAWLVRAAADVGDPTALVFVGLMHLHGVGANVANDLAADCFRRGAATGNTLATVYWAHCLFTGTGVARDLALAVELWRSLPAEPLAMLALGECYETGLGVQCDLNQAEGWYRAALDASSVVPASVRLEGLTLLLREADRAERTGESQIDAGGARVPR